MYILLNIPLIYAHTQINLPKSLLTNGFTLKGSKSSICSPVPMNIIGLWVAATLKYIKLISVQHSLRHIQSFCACYWENLLFIRKMFLKIIFWQNVTYYHTYYLCKKHKCELTVCSVLQLQNK